MEAIVIYYCYKNIQFKAKDSEIKVGTVYLGNIFKDFTIDNLKNNSIKMKCICFC